jgi:biopolymer transport protein ExbB
MRIECRWKATILFAIWAMALTSFAFAPAWAQEEPAAQPAEGMQEAATQTEEPTTQEETLPPEATFTLPTGEEEEPVVEQEEEGGFGAGAVEFFRQGGDFMWPLLFCSLLGLAVILERLWTLHRAHVNTRKLMTSVLGALRDEGVEAAKGICTKTRGPIAAILHSGLLRADKGPEAVEKAIESAGAIEMSFLERGLVVLSTISNVAPMLGFSGTVSGMIHAFQAIAAAEQVSAKLVATGISEALITTLTGLLIAIPVQAAHNYFVSRIDRFVMEMEESSVDLVDTLVDLETRKAARA